MKRLVLFLTIIIIGLGGYLGWRHWHTSPKSSSSNSSQKITDPSEGGKYLVIKEWGVRIPLTENIKDAQYSQDDDNTISLTTIRANQVSGCGNKKIFSEERGKKGDPIGATTVNELLDENPGALTRLGEYYYLFNSASYSCASTSDKFGYDYITKVQDELTKASKAIVKVN